MDPRRAADRDPDPRLDSESDFNRGLDPEPDSHRGVRVRVLLKWRGPSRWQGSVLKQLETGVPGGSVAASA